MTDLQGRDPSARSMASGGYRPAASIPLSLPSWYRTPRSSAARDDDATPERPDTPAADPQQLQPEPSILPEPVDTVTVMGGVGVVDLPTADADDNHDDDDRLPAPRADRIGITADTMPFLDVPAGWTDAFTGLDGPIYWARLLSGEAARIRRYHRPATVVLFEVVALDRLARQWGDDVAVQSLLNVARMLSRHIRSSDHAARIGTIRFGAYLPETNEIDAINFVERCRAAIIRDLGTAGETVTLAIGWAEPVDGDLDAAVLVAEARLEKEIEAAR